MRCYQSDLGGLCYLDGETSSNFRPIHCLHSSTREYLAHRIRSVFDPTLLYQLLIYYTI